MYLAKTYIGMKYAPGEIIDDLPKEQAEWLIGAGAVEVLAPTREEPEPDHTAGAPEIDVMEGVTDKPKRTRKASR